MSFRRSLTNVSRLCLFLFVSSVFAQENGVMMQYFHWYMPNDGSLWRQVSANAQDLANVGITALWLPPAYKGDSGKDDVGYGVYDMYDLGEFDQQGSVRTRYGTKDEYLTAITTSHNAGVQVYGDVVFNHRGGADATEWVKATRVASDNRNREYGGDIWIQAWTRFDFPDRGNTYSDFKWRWYHFDGVDWDQSRKENDVVYKLRGDGKGWDWEVDTENGNYDYLMFADVDFQHPDVREELKSWGEWYLNMTQVDGFRLDAVKHIQYDFFSEWIDHLRNTTGEELFTVGEYWNYDLGSLTNYIDKTGGRIALFDAPLHLNFHIASTSSGFYDMRKLMDGTLMRANPALAVTLVENHDTQPLQALESPVADWFKPLAYAFILLRAEGYPNVFYADYYGAQYTDKGQNIQMASHRQVIDTLLWARKNFAYGTQRDYLDHWDIIGWTRAGNSAHPGSLAVLMSDGPGGGKWMETGKPFTTYRDATGNRTDRIRTNRDGWAEFKVNGGSVSVWVEE